MIRTKKVRIRQDKSREEIIEEVMRDNEEYFQTLASRTGQDINELRKQYRQLFEKDLEDYQQGEEVEIEMVEVE